MKFLIAFALIAAVAAHPEPIELSKAEEPAFETQDVEPIVLPKAALPMAQPEFEPIDISPLIVPQEVMDTLNLETAEIPAEAVKVVDNVEEIPALPVNFVDNVDAPLESEAEIAEVPAEPQFIYLPQAEEPVDEVQPIVLPEPALPAFEQMLVQPVLIDISPVIVPQDVIEALKLVGMDEFAAEPVKFVENEAMELAEDIPVMPVNFVNNVEAPVDESEGLKVHFVDVAENAPAVDQPEAPVDSVRIVEIPERSPREQIAPGELEAIRVNAPEFQAGMPVKVVDGSVFRRKVFADPRLR